MLPLTAKEQHLLNNISPAAKQAKLGDKLADIATPGAAPAHATDNASAITQLNALIDALKTKGLLA